MSKRAIFLTVCARNQTGKHPDLLATSGEHLCLWEVVDDQVRRKATLSNVRIGRMTHTCDCSRRMFFQVKNSDFGAPLTSFDWHDNDPNLIATSSIDTTCTIWNVETGQARTQLIAHDREVFDVAFARDPNHFASVGADGSVRMFDLRYAHISALISLFSAFAAHRRPLVVDLVERLAIIDWRVHQLVCYQCFIGPFLL